MDSITPQWCLIIKQSNSQTLKMQGSCPWQSHDFSTWGIPFCDDDTSSLMHNLDVQLVCLLCSPLADVKVEAVGGGSGWEEGGDKVFLFTVIYCIFCNETLFWPHHKLEELETWILWKKLIIQICPWFLGEWRCSWLYVKIDSPLHVCFRRTIAWNKALQAPENGIQFLNSHNQNSCLKRRLGQNYAI